MRTLAPSGWKWDPVARTPTPPPEPQPSPGPGSHLPTEALAGLRNGLGGHERWGPGRAGQPSVVPLKLVADAKVGDLHVPVVPQEQVGWLDVPVDDLLVVHCRERQLERWPRALPPRPPTCSCLAVEAASNSKREGAGTSCPLHTFISRGPRAPCSAMQ